MSVISVWSTHGHRFYETTSEHDGGRDERCLTCGGVWTLVPDGYDPARGTYEASNGDEPIYCTGRCDLYHGTEAVCQADNGRGCPAGDEYPCEHLATEHGCNCLHCTG